MSGKGPSHQVGDLRRGRPAIGAGDEATEEVYMNRCRAAEAKQKHQYAVAPGQRVVAQRNGEKVMLEPGDEVRLSDLIGGDGSPAMRLDRLIVGWIVLEKVEE